MQLMLAFLAFVSFSAWSAPTAGTHVDTDPGLISEYTDEELFIQNAWFIPGSNMVLYYANMKGLTHVVKTMDYTTGEISEVYKAEGWVSAADFSPSLGSLFIGTADSLTSVDVVSGTIIAQVDSSFRIESIDLSKDGNRVLISGRAEFFEIYDPMLTKHFTSPDMPNGYRDILCAEFLNEDKIFLCPTQGGNTVISPHVWTLSTNSLQGYKPEGRFWITGAKMTAAGLIISTNDKARLLNPESLKMKLEWRRYDGWRNRLPATWGEDYILSRHGEGQIKLLNAHSGSLVRKFQFGPIERVQALAVDEVGQLGLSSSGGTIRVWDLNDGLPFKEVRAHVGGVTAFASMPKIDRFATSGQGAEIKIWDSKGDLILGYEEHLSPAFCLDFSESGNFALSVEEGGVTHFWNANTGDKIWSLDAGRPISSCSLSSDGKNIALGMSDGSVLIYKSDSSLSSICQGHDGSVRKVGLAHGVARLVTAGQDKTVRIWSFNENSCNQDRIGQRRSFASKVMFSQDNSKVFVGLGSIYIWNAGNGRLMRTVGAGASFDLIENESYVVSVNPGEKIIRYTDFASQKVLRTIHHDTSFVGLGATSETVFGVSADGVMTGWSL